MTIQPDEDIRLRPDGSIDTAYYMARGRHARSQQAHRMARACLPEKRERRSFWSVILA